MKSSCCSAITYEYMEEIYCEFCGNSCTEIPAEPPVRYPLKYKISDWNFDTFGFFVSYGDESLWLTVNEFRSKTSELWHQKSESDIEANGDYLENIYAKEQNEINFNNFVAGLNEYYISEVLIDKLK